MAPRKLKISSVLCICGSHPIPVGHAALNYSPGPNPGPGRLGCIAPVLMEDLLASRLSLPQLVKVPEIPEPPLYVGGSLAAWTSHGDKDAGGQGPDRE